MKVLLDARLPEGAGGVRQSIVGLLRGLVTSGSEHELVVAAYPGQRQWLLEADPSATLQILEVKPPPQHVANGRLRRLLDLEPIGTAIRTVRAVAPLPSEPRWISSVDPDVIHFPGQSAFRTDRPCVFTPHDLQHRHLPGLFPSHVRVWRDRTYRAWCAQARSVVVMTEWGKADLIHAYGLPERKVHVVPWASVLSLQSSPSDADLARVRATYQLPERFALYPSQPYRHKNHERLFAAQALLASRGIRIPIVCTGYGTDGLQLGKLAASAGTLDSVIRCGYVPPVDMRAIYELAYLLVFPSLFEGWGLPITEAFEIGLPVAASDVTCIPEVADGAAVLFDPRDLRSIADAVAAIWEDPELRAELSTRGRARSAAFSWEASARRLTEIFDRSLAAHDADTGPNTTTQGS